MKMYFGNSAAVLSLFFVFFSIRLDASTFSSSSSSAFKFSSAGKEALEAELAPYRKRVEEMFYHAYDNYLEHAFPYDELRPLTCDGINTWGNFQLTLIDALDTLVVMGNNTEFRRVAEMVIDNLHDFDIDVNTSVFEANIRVVGGLISAHLFSKRAGMRVEAGWPCSGPLLRLAVDLGRRLLPAFDTATGMPYGTVNLKHGVPEGETSITCTACVATFVLEFGTLSRLTGDPSFENAALVALDSLWKARSAIGLVGNHIDVEKNVWHALDAGIGAGVDSYFEYLVKGALAFEMPELMNMFREYAESIAKYLAHGDWHFWAHMHKGGVTQPVFQSLEAFWPGMLTLVGETQGAAAILKNYFAIWKQFGFTPEFFDVARGQPMNKREGYPLRPELIESTMYLYQSTSDAFFLSIGASVLASIEESSRVPCGFATVKNVNDHSLDNRMESFFLAETTKYLYLLFTPDHWIFNGWNPENVETIRSPVNRPNASDCFLGASGFIFNTEAHPIDVSAVHCCSKQKADEDLQVKRMLQRISLASLLTGGGDVGGGDGQNHDEDVLQGVFDELMGIRPDHDEEEDWEEEENDYEEEEEEEKEDSTRKDAGKAAKDAPESDPDVEIEEAKEEEEEENSESDESHDSGGEGAKAESEADSGAEAEANSGAESSIDAANRLVGEEASPSSPAENEEERTNVIVPPPGEVSSLASAVNLSATSASAAASNDAATNDAAASSVEAKIREIVQKREQKNRIVEAPRAEETSSSSSETTEAAQTWRQLAANILTRLKVEAGLKVAGKLQTLFSEPKLPPTKMRSNVDSWQSMTCPRRPWPAELGVYAFH